MKCSFMSRTVPSEWKKAETNSEPWLEVTCEGMPCLEQTWRTKNLANIVDVMVSMVRIKIDCLVRWFKSFLTVSQDLKVNLCGLQQDNVVMVMVRIIMWESPGDSHAVARQWVCMGADPLLCICTNIVIII